MGRKVKVNAFIIQNAHFLVHSHIVYELIAKLKMLDEIKKNCNKEVTRTLNNDKQKN